MSLPYGPLAGRAGSVRRRWAVAALTAGMAGAAVDGAAADTPPEQVTAATAGPSLRALGVLTRVGPETSGAQAVSVSATPNFVLRWGRLSVTNGGPLASRAGEPAEAGLSADLLSRDRWRVSASLSVDQGRNSDDIDRLRGLHDIPSHLRGRLRAGWRLHDQWELSSTWRTDVSGRGTGQAVDLTLLHEWRPEFLDHTRWRVSVGASVDWLDATRANLVYGVTAQDEQRSTFAAYRLDPGISEWRVFTHWRRELDHRWVVYGSLTASELAGQAARSPIVQQRGGLGLSLGLGRRF